MVLIVCLTTLTTLSAAGSPIPKRSAVKEWLSRTVLTAGETRNQLERFVKKRIPPVEPGVSPDEWEDNINRRRKDVLEKVILRGVPPEWLDASLGEQWLDVIDSGKGYRIRKFRYEAVPGLWIPALLYEPENLSGAVPAILNVNGHEYVTGKATEYEQVRCINLAKRGMLALHPEWLNCGELHRPGYEHNRLAYLDLCGTSGVSVFYLAMRRALDILAAHPNADPNRIAMTGLSGGGWQTIILSALDSRIKLSVPNAGYIGLAMRAEFVQDIGDCEQNPADLISVADYTHLTAMLAPRPALLLYNEKDDCCFEAYRAKPSVYDPVVPFYACLGDPDDFQFYENRDPGTHNYERDNREQFYRFINRHFLPESQRTDADIECKDEVLSPEALHVGCPDTNATFVSLAEGLLEHVPANRPPAEPGAAAQWRQETEERLRNVLRLKPAEITSEIVDQQSGQAVHVTWYKFLVNEEWSLPGVAITGAENGPAGVTIFFADAGKAGLVSSVAALLIEGARVIAVDPFLMGENAVSWQHAMLVDTVGERCLGVQVQQIGALIRWSCREFGVERVALHAIGRNAGVVALASCALHRDLVAHVTVEDVPESLRLLITNRVEYEAVPALFCFGLLPVADVDTLEELCRPVTVDVLREN